MEAYVFVNSIVKAPPGVSGVIVEASNGTPQGPPFVKFNITNPNEIQECFIGKRYHMKLEAQ